MILNKSEQYYHSCRYENVQCDLLLFAATCRGCVHGVTAYVARPCCISCSQRADELQASEPKVKRHEMPRCVGTQVAWHTYLPHPNPSPFWLNSAQVSYYLRLHVIETVRYRLCVTHHSFTHSKLCIFDISATTRCPLMVQRQLLL